MAGNTDGRDAGGPEPDAESTAGDAGWNAERAWWREHFRTRPYVAADRPFAEYEAAYRFGYEGARRNGKRAWREALPDLREGWNAAPRAGDARANWAAVSPAVQDAFTRTARRRREAERRRASIHGDAMLLV